MFSRLPGIRLPGIRLPGIRNVSAMFGSPSRGRPEHMMVYSPLCWESLATVCLSPATLGNRSPLALPLPAIVSAGRFVFLNSLISPIPIFGKAPGDSHPRLLFPPEEVTPRNAKAARPISSAKRMQGRAASEARRLGPSVPQAFGRVNRASRRHGSRPHPDHTTEGKPR